MSFAVGEIISMKGGGWDSLHTSLVLDQSIDTETVAVSEDGVADVTLEVREAKELETKDANSKPVEGAKGATGTYRVDSTGVVQNLVLVPPPDSTFKASDLDALKSLLRLNIFPVPTEAIGIGAKSTVTQVVNEHQLQMNEQMAIELVKRTGSQLVLRVEIEGRGSRDTIVGDQHQTLGLDSHTKLLAKLSPTKLVPRSLELENQTVQTVKPEGVDDPKEQLRITIDRTVEMRSK